MSEEILSMKWSLDDPEIVEIETVDGVVRIERGPKGQLVPTDAVAEVARVLASKAPVDVARVVTVTKKERG